VDPDGIVAVTVTFDLDIGIVKIPLEEEDN